MKKSDSQVVIFAPENEILFKEKAFELSKQRFKKKNIGNDGSKYIENENK